MTNAEAHAMVDFSDAIHPPVYAVRHALLLHPIPMSVAENVMHTFLYVRCSGRGTLGIYFYSSLGEDARHTGSGEGGGAEPIQ